MDTATEILVIITSSVLVLFLLVAIWAGVLLILVLRKIRRLAKRAEDLAEAVESIGEAVKFANTPLRFKRLLQNLAEGLKQVKDKKGK